MALKGPQRSPAESPHSISKDPEPTSRYSKSLISKLQSQEDTSSALPAPSPVLFNL